MIDQYLIFAADPYTVCFLRHWCANYSFGVCTIACTYDMQTKILIKYTAQKTRRVKVRHSLWPEDYVVQRNCYQLHTAFSKIFTRYQLSILSNLKTRKNPTNRIDIATSQKF